MTLIVGVCREEDPEDSVPHGHITSLVSRY